MKQPSACALVRTVVFSLLALFSSAQSAVLAPSPAPPRAPEKIIGLGRDATVAEAQTSGDVVVAGGKAVVRGSTCSQLAFTQEDVDWQLWVDEVVPVIRHVVITYKKLPGAPRFSATFTSWDFNLMIPDSVFAFEPPPGITYGLAPRPRRSVARASSASSIAVPLGTRCSFRPKSLSRKTLPDSL